MIVQAFSIYDRKAGFYAVPYFFPTIGQGTRAFRATAADESTILHKYPEDFELYRIATYDDSTGKFESLEHPEFICNGVLAKETET